MHASTARACLRKLSDWVNSVSKHHTSERIIPCFSRVSCGFLPPRWRAIAGFAQLFRFSPDNTLDSSRGMPQSTRKLNVVPALRVEPTPACAEDGCPAHVRLQDRERKSNADFVVAQPPGDGARGQRARSAARLRDRKSTRL